MLDEAAAIDALLRIAAAEFIRRAQHAEGFEQGLDLGFHAVRDAGTGFGLIRGCGESHEERGEQ